MSVIETSINGSPSSEPPVSGVSDPSAAVAERRSRASLRRLAAGEQRKRAVRLTEALENDGFCLRYIPRQRLIGAPRMAADQIEGGELWVGLPNRRRGVVSVAPLLRDLERPGLREDMLRFSLDAAAAEVAIWPANWRLSVPVPTRTLADGAVADILMAALAKAGISDGRIDLQIDESDLVEGGVLLHHAMGALRTRGVGVVLDGFGATFGSLALLPRLPLTSLKLDRRLAHSGGSDADSDESVLIRAAVEIAHRLGITVTIDGIETEAELERFRQLGVDFVQGPWIGPAMAAEAIRVRGRSAQ